MLHVPVLILGSGHNVISSFPIQPPGFYTDLAVHRAGVMGTPYGSYVAHAAGDMPSAIRYFGWIKGTLAQWELELY